MTTPASRHLPPGIHQTAVNGCDIRDPRAGSRTPVAPVRTLRTQLEIFQQTTGQPDTTQAEVIAIDLPGHGQSTAPPLDHPAGYPANAAEAPPDHLDPHQAADAGEPTGAPAGLIPAARDNPRPAHVTAVNPMTTAAGTARPGPHSPGKTQVTASPRRSKPSPAQPDKETR